MTPEEKQSSAERAAKKYAEGCDNESGSFLSRDLEKIRKKGFLAGAEWKASQVAEAGAEKREDHAKGWWLDLSLEELREEFAALEELECENQAALAELGAPCLEKSTDGIWTLGNLLHDARAESARLRSDK